MSDEIQRETMDVDLLIVGGGSAGLSCAIHFQNLVKAHNEGVQSGRITGEVLADPVVVVLEKGPEVGAHSFSGAVLNPIALQELVPNFSEAECPLGAPVVEDAVYYLTRTGAIKAPITPPPFQNHGNYVVSVSKLNRWLGGQAEARGVNIFPGFSAVEALYEGDKVVGVRTGDKGCDKHGKPKANFEAGMLLKAKVTVFAEGTRGSLFRQVSDRLGLRKDCNEEVFEEGVKEIIQMPAGTVKPGQVIHTMGFPLKETIGGTFIYTLPGDQIILGLVGYLDTTDPLFDPHRELQRLKTHPFVKKMIEGGKVIHYGGKTLPAGGWYSMPKLYHDGMMVVGDSASMVDVKKLKGIHLAMKSGMLAAETALEAVQKGDSSAKVLEGYEKRIHGSYVKDHLYAVRNFHQALSRGFLVGMPLIAAQEITGGRGLFDQMSAEKDSHTTEPLVEIWGSQGQAQEDVQIPKPDGVLFFDKLSSVYLTGTRHDEDSPNHLIVTDPDICRNTCHPKYASPCNHFCPANVYEMIPDGEEGQKKLMVNYTNCIHCKTCDIKCPFENILWTVPEGGGGPRYTET